MPQKNPAAIIFDYGSVLVGPLDRPVFAANLDALSYDYGFDNGQALWNHIYVSETWEQAKRGRISYDALWTDRLGLLGIKDRAEQMAFKQRLFTTWGVFPEMRVLLNGLHSLGYRLCVLSNSARQNFRAYLEDRRGFIGLFDIVVSSAEVGFAKPEEEIYRITLTRLGLTPSTTLFIDDLPRNTQAAERVGIPTIVFTSPSVLVAELQRRSVL